MTCCPVAMAMDTRWCPSLTKCRSPIRYTSMGGMLSPRLVASARRRARWKSSATSARGKPVSAGMGVAVPGVLDAGARLDLQQMPSHDVAHHGPAEPVVAGHHAVRVDVTVQQHGGLEPRGEPVQ